MDVVVLPRLEQREQAAVAQRAIRGHGVRQELPRLRLVRVLGEARALIPVHGEPPARRTHRRRRIRRPQREHVHVRGARQGGRVDEEEELPGDVVGVVEHQLLLLHQPFRAVAAEPELARGDVALLLSPQRLHLRGPHLRRRLEAEVAGRDPLRQVARRRQVDRHVAHLHALQQLARLPLVVDADVVRGVELAALVVVHVDVDPVRDRAAHLHAELHIGAQLREQARAAVEPQPRLAWTVLVPHAAQVAPTLHPQLQVRRVLHRPCDLALAEPPAARGVPGRGRRAWARGLRRGAGHPDRRRHCRKPARCRHRRDRNGRSRVPRGAQ